MSRLILRRMGLALIVLSLSACATIKKPGGAVMSPDIEKAWQQHLEDMEDVDSWDIKGKMAVRTADDGGSATFLWLRKQSDHRIEMYGPFGGGRAVIAQNHQGANLRDNKKNYFEDKNAELLLYRRVGWHVPFNAMNFWMKGVPMPGPVKHLELGADGKALAFQQDGWDVRYLDYTERLGLVVPRKMFLTALPGTVHLVDEEGADLGDKLEVKVVLRRWLPVN
ncbi:MAG: outer membrane lipoprotein LolB [Parasphingorhabdus sp.]|jgi:outer membrane lipoprotein LolB